MTYFCPALDPPLGWSGRKTTTLVRDHEYFIPTKFHQNPSSGSGEEVENVKSLWTDDGRCAMTIAHSSLRLRWAKKVWHSKNVSRSTDQSDYRKLTWGIIIKIVDRQTEQSDHWKLICGIIHQYVVQNNAGAYTYWDNLSTHTNWLVSGEGEKVAIYNEQVRQNNLTACMICE